MYDKTNKQEANKPQNKKNSNERSFEGRKAGTPDIESDKKNQVNPQKGKKVNENA